MNADSPESTTLWGGEGSLDQQVDEYTVGKDRIFDHRLLPWDILGTIGHVKGLRRVGFLTEREEQRLVDALRTGLQWARDERLTVTAQDEDVHSTVERFLVEKLGELGEKVHTGRSRNDQVMVDLRLYLKSTILEIMNALLDLAEAAIDFAKAHERVLMPGYTHQRRAMPSTVGLWAAALAEGLLDDIVPLESSFRLLDRSPLGSGAGYGVPMALDRAGVAESLGFSGIQPTVTAVQSSRGKLDVVLLSALWSIGYDLGKLAWDVILFSSDEFGFFEFPLDLATGSSIMPHKRNPDVMEITRANARLLDGCLSQAIAVVGSLPSGYHRDMQLVKGIVMEATDLVAAMLAMSRRCLEGLAVNHERCGASMTPELLATDEVFRLVREGKSFRSAYREVAAAVRAGKPVRELDHDEILEARSWTIGGAGAIGLDRLAEKVKEERGRVFSRKQCFQDILDELSGEESTSF